MVAVYWILSFLLGIIPAWIVFRKDRKKDIRLKWLPAFLRWLTFSFTALLLLAPAFSGLSNKEEPPILIWLQDVSTSTNASLGNYKNQYQSQSQATIQELKKKYEVLQFGFGNNIVADSIYNYNQKTTDIANAIQTLAEQYQDRNIGAIILASDGIFNQGSNPLFNALPKPVNIYSIALGDSTVPKDISANQLNANKTVSLNSTFEIIADISATRLSGINTTATLSNNGQTIATAPIKISGNEYSTSITFTVKATQKGLQQFTVSIPKTEAESNTQNNSQSIFVEVVEEQSKILLLADAPHPDIAAIKTAIGDIAQYKLNVITNGKMPEDINTYDIIIAYQYTPKGNMPNVPTWYILGSNSNIAALKNLPNNIIINGSNATADAPPALNDGFNIFTLPENIRQVLPKLAPLSMIQSNISTSGNVLFSSGGNPLWSYYPGNTPISILKGEGIWRWGMYEYKNFKSRNVTNGLIRQCINFLQVKKDKRPFKVYMNDYNISDNQAAILFAELQNNSGELINTPEATLSLKGPNNTNYNYTFEKTGNSYRLNAGMLGAGKYSFTGKVNFNGKNYEGYGIFNVMDIPLEQLRTHADYNLMYQLAHKNNGAFFTQYTFKNIVDSIKNNTNIKPLLHSKSESTPLINTKWLFFLILLTAAAEWFLRKYWGLS